MHSTPLRTLLRRLIEPLSLAGLLTWLAILLGIVRNTPSDLLPLVLGLLGGFGLSLIVGMLIDDERAPLRWRRVLVFVQMLLGLATCTIAREGLAPVLLVIVVAQLPPLLPRRGFVVLMIAINLALYLIVSRIWGSSMPVLLTMIHAGFQVFAAAMTIYAERAEAARAELAQVNAHLLATHSLLEESARDGERLRLARELHDVAGHTLTALKLQLALLAREPNASPAVATAAGLADSLLGDIRGVVGQLRDADGLDLRQAIAQLAAPMPRPTVHLDMAEDARVDDIAQAQALLRVAQEALTNAARHSGATNLWLRLLREGRALVLEVRDDGRGARTLQIGHGLAGMRERLAAVGGTLTISSERGFSVTARVPLA